LQSRQAAKAGQASVRTDGILVCDSKESTLLKGRNMFDHIFSLSLRQVWPNGKTQHLVRAIASAIGKAVL